MASHSSGSGAAASIGQNRPSLRVAFIHPDLGIGGAEKLVVDAAVGLERLGHDCEIITSYHDPNHCFEPTRDGACAGRGRVRGAIVDCLRLADLTLLANHLAALLRRKRNSQSACRQEHHSARSVWRVSPAVRHSATDVALLPAACRPLCFQVSRHNSFRSVQTAQRAPTVGSL